jgi:hypothetical protein
VNRPDFPDDMAVIATSLAESTANVAKASEANGGIKVDAVFVLCFRASDDSAGSALVAPGIPIDAMIGMIVSALGKLRSSPPTSSSLEKL